MARTQPGAYCKILTLLVPRELKLEHRNVIADLSDEQLEAMIAELGEQIARRAAGSDAKLIEAVDTTTSSWCPSLSRCPSSNDGTRSWLRRTLLCLAVTRRSPAAERVRPPPHRWLTLQSASAGRGSARCRCHRELTVWTRRWRADLCGSNRATRRGLLLAAERAYGKPSPAAPIKKPANTMVK